MKVGKVRQVSAADGLLTAGEQSQTSVSAADLDNVLTTLEQLDSSNLQMRWRDLFGRHAPARLGPDLLRRAIAYRLQELALGGLSRQSQLRLKAIGNQSGKEGTGRQRVSSPAIIKPGTRFVREWQNEIHEVQAIDTGDFVYRARTYRSLSIIAREITGTHQSGPRFFGMRKNDSKVAAREVTHG